MNHSPSESHLKEKYSTYSEGNNNYQMIGVQTGYIKPGESYDVILDRAAKHLQDQDFLVISETPLAISQGRLVDETEFIPSLSAYLLAELWSKYLWGYFLGPLLGIKKRTIKNLRKLPPEARPHKELILQRYGWRHALKPASEAGVDLSNAPGTCVSLLPHDPQGLSEEIGAKIVNSSGKNVTVVIIDTDATYQLGKIIFTSLPVSASGIRNNWGLFAYLLGRFGRILGPTPLVISQHHKLEKIFQIARAAEEHQKIHENNMETVYDMQKLLEGKVNTITIDMLDSITHMPAVIVREV